MPVTSTDSEKSTNPQVSVGQFYALHSDLMSLRLIAGAEGMDRFIKEGSVNRLGLVLTGFFKFFASRRIQIIGKSEMAYLRSLDPSTRRERIRDIFSKKIPCIIFSRNIRPPAFFIEEAERYGVPLFRSEIKTNRLVNQVAIALEQDFAPSTSIHSSMVDIQGVGVLIRGESGIGKSECVLGLIERGYSLVADDITKIKCIEGTELMATSADLTRHYMEVRGIGVINVASIFGASSIRNSKRIDLVVTLMDWTKMENINRTGLDQEYFEILQIKVPHVTIPVRSGRDISGLIEVAALDQKLKSLGHHSASEFNERLINKMQSKES